MGLIQFAINNPIKVAVAVILTVMFGMISLLATPVHVNARRVGAGDYRHHGMAGCHVRRKLNGRLSTSRKSNSKASKVSANSQVKVATRADRLC